MEDIQDKKTTFLEAERLFKTELRYYPQWLRGTFQVCCTPEEQKDIIETGDIIKTIHEFSTLSFSDIYLVLIYVHYSLDINEQSNDWLDMSFLENNTEDPELCQTLYLKITTGDIMINDRNLSSDLRKKIMGMLGGRRKRNKSKRNKSKRNKSKRNKSKRNKTKYNRIKKKLY
jgi:hypothetical protein